MHDHEANEARLAACGGMEALLRALRPGSASARVREAALEALGKPRRAEHKLRMLPAGGVPLLVAALRPPGTPRTPYVASVTLHNLSITGQEAKRAIAAAGALPLLVGLLQPAGGQVGGVEDELALDTRESAADALCTLAYANMDNCDAIMRIPEALPALVSLSGCCCDQTATAGWVGASADSTASLSACLFVPKKGKRARKSCFSLASATQLPTPFRPAPSLRPPACVAGGHAAPSLPGAAWRRGAGALQPVRAPRLPIWSCGCRLHHNRFEGAR